MVLLFLHLLHSTLIHYNLAFIHQLTHMLIHILLKWLRLYTLMTRLPLLILSLLLQLLDALVLLLQFQIRTILFQIQSWLYQYQSFLKAAVTAQHSLILLPTKMDPLCHPLLALMQQIWFSLFIQLIHPMLILILFK